jgi:hypothetical protein
MKDVDDPEANSTVPSDTLSKSVLGNSKPTFLAGADSAHSAQSTSGPHTTSGSGLSSKVAPSPTGHSGSTDLLPKAGGPSSPALMTTSAYASASVDVQVAAGSALANIHLDVTASALSTPGRNGMASSDVRLNVEALSAGQSGPSDLLPASRGSSPPVGKAIPAHAGANIHVQLAASALSTPGMIGSEHGF